MKTTKNNDLSKGNINKFMFTLAIPAVVAQLINVLYNMVDRIYIANIKDIGSTALTGVGVTFPIILIISAFSAFVGSGGAPLASIKLGERDQEGAEKILGNSIFMLAVLSAALMVVFFAFKEQMLMAFGASENTIGYALEYLNIYLIGTPVALFSLGLNAFISAQGKAKTAMVSVAIGAVLNIVLDPLFIFTFNMGVSGAALATILSQAVSAIWVVRFLLSKDSQIRIRKEKIKPDKRVVMSIAMLGVSPFIMQATESLVQVVLNRGMLQYGSDLYVGTMTIIISISQLFITPISGFTNGIQPLMGYNFGAGKMQRVKDVFKRMLVVTVAFSTLASIVTVAFPQFFVGLFTPDPQLLELTCKGLRIYMAGVWMFGVQMACQAAFMSFGQAKLSLFNACLRKIILLVPLALILPMFMGVNGVYMAEPIADIVAGLVTGLLFLHNVRRILDDRMIALSANSDRPITNA